MKPKPSTPRVPKNVKTPEAAAAEPPPAASAEAFEQLRTELEEAQDRALRFQAELDNFRKRADRDREEQLRYANMGLLRDLLLVLDNMHRAIEAAEKSTDGAGLLDGFKLVRQQLEGVLQRYHCEKIDALHAPFDPHFHEAISQQCCAEHPAGTVILVTQEGYRLHDRVVRPSQVIVSTAPPSPEPSDEPGGYSVETTH